MKNAIFAAFGAGMALLLCSTPAFAQANERVMYASVVDSKGQPVSGLAAKDFVVREDGMAREILRVAPDEDPLQIALLVDNGIEMRNKVSDLRRALTAFVSTLRPGVQMSLITLAERPTILVPYTADHGVLQGGIDRVIAYEAGNYLLDAIAESATGLSKRLNARSIIAVVTARGPELSYQEYTDVLRIVRASGTPALHAMVVGGAEADAQIFAVQRASPADGGDRISGASRDIVLGRLTRETGGRYEEVLTMSALTMKLQQMAGELSKQYRVTFASPDRLVPATKTDISARDPKLTARGMLQKPLP